MKKIVFPYIVFVMALAVSAMVKIDVENQTLPSCLVNQEVCESDHSNWHPAEKIFASDTIPPRKWHPAEKLA